MRIQISFIFAGKFHHVPLQNVLGCASGRWWEIINRDTGKIGRCWSRIYIQIFPSAFCVPEKIKLKIHPPKSFFPLLWPKSFQGWKLSQKIASFVTLYLIILSWTSEVYKIETLKARPWKIKQDVFTLDGKWSKIYWGNSWEKWRKREKYMLSNCAGKEELLKLWELYPSKICDLMILFEHFSNKSLRKLI